MFKTCAAIVVLGFFSLQACSSDSSSSSTASGGFQITVSGEDLAVNGYDFTPGAKADDDPPPFVDGWEVRFTHVIVTVDNIRLNADPDSDPGNHIQLHTNLAIPAESMRRNSS